MTVTMNSGMRESAGIFAVALLACLVVSARAHSADVKGDAAASARAELFEHEKRYKAVAHKPSTLPNLLHSVDVKDVRGFEAAETAAALDILRLRGKPDTETVTHIARCFEGNSYGGLRVKAAQALLELEPGTGVRFAKTALDDDSVELDTRLLLVESLVRRGYLFGYPLLREGVVSASEIVRRASLRILEIYRPYDGSPWNHEGAKVDIAALERLAHGMPQM